MKKKKTYACVCERNGATTNNESLLLSLAYMAYNYMRVNSDTFFVVSEKHGTKKFACKLYYFVRLFNGVVVNTWACYKYFVFFHT